MDSPTLTLDDLTNLFDDVAPAEHDESPDNTGVPVLAPLPSGKYGVHLLTIDVDRNQDGSVRSKTRFVCDFKVTDPPADAQWAEGRKVRFIRLSGESRKRKINGIDKAYVELFDLVHAFDPTFACNGSIQTALGFLLEKIADNSTCYIQLDWKAWDSKYWQSQSGDTLAEGDEKKALRKACSFQGMKRFGVDGTALNPASGHLLKAQSYMKWAYIPKTPSA